MNLIFAPQTIGGTLIFGLQVLASTTRTLTLTLCAADGTLLPSQTSIGWAFFDQPSPGLLLAPTSKGIGASSDASAVINLPIVGSSLATNGLGYVTLSNTDGTLTGPSLAFSATVKLP